MASGFRVSCTLRKTQSKGRYSQEGFRVQGSGVLGFRALGFRGLGV